MNIFVWFLIQPLAAQYGGELDETFGSGGKVVLEFNSFGSTAMAMHLLPDGSILLAGTSQGVNTFVAKLLPDGTTDNTFGINGVVEHLFGCYYTNCTGISAQSDGKILLTGFLMQSDTAVYEKLFVARLNTDGSVDASFANNGLFLHSTVFNSSGQFVKVQPDGKILVGGYAGVDIQQGNSVHEYLLVRLNNDGSPDTAFNSSGELRVDFDTLSDIAYALTLQNDGKIVMVGNSYNYTYTAGYMTLVRINTDGTPDNGFGNGGKVLYNPSIPYSWDDKFVAVVIQPDGKIVCGGSATAQAAVVRFTSNGIPDGTFGNNGLFTYIYSSSLTQVHALCLQDDGKILWGGFTDYGNTQAVMVTGRILPNGTVDNTWGSTQSGAQITYVTGSTTNCSINAVCMQSDGKLLVCGYGANTINTGYAAAARFLTGLNSGMQVPATMSQTHFFPNPAHPGQNVKLSFPKESQLISVEVFNSSGRSTSIYTLHNSGSVVTFNAPEQSGLYMVRFSSEKEVYYFKLMVY